MKYLIKIMVLIFGMGVAVQALAVPAVRPGFDANTLTANDDGSTGLVDIGFTLNFFGNTFSQGFVNNNGNMTFDYPLGTFTPFGLSTTNRVIIAPFFADVDTSVAGSAPVTYGQGMVGSRPAFAANWVDVACFATASGGYNSFQMVLIDRSDIAPGDFDIEFNYDQIDWETGQASGGNGVCKGGSSARVGFSNGSTSSFELAGSGVNGAFLDTNLTTGLIHNNRNSLEPGRYVFEVRNGVAPTGHHIAGTVFANNTGTPLTGSLVQVCTTAVGGMQCNLSRSNGAGDYLIGGLADDGYEITAFPPASSDFHIGNRGPVTLAGVDLDGQDIILQGPQPLPSNTVITPSNRTSTGGEPVVYWHNPLTLSTQGCAGGIANYSITQTDSGAIVASGAMQEDPANPGSYSAQFAPFYPAHGQVTVEITINCPNGSVDTVVFSMYIDPSGVVTDTMGNPVAGATVQLFRSDSSAGPFVAVPDGSDVMSPTNRTTPDLTTDQGLFGWDVISGFYTVRASAENCVSPDDPTQAFVESSVLDIPPEVTDLQLVLQCEQPVFAVCDINRDGFVSRTDLGLLQRLLRSNVTPGTSGDINNDGVISSQDLRGCVFQCTLPRCAESQ